MCCFNRPYDDQTYLTIALESEAKLYVQREALQGNFELAWSYILDYENSFNPYESRRVAISRWRSIATVDVDISEDIETLANNIMHKGIKKKDALHIACAITADCHYFLTTDKKLLNKHFHENTLINPLDFVRGLEARR